VIQINYYEKIKSKLFVLFEILNPFFYGLVVYLFRWINICRKRPKVLIFTDSRGFEVTKFWNRKNPFSSYIGRLILDYNCTIRVCPEKFTSLLDFLSFYESVKYIQFDSIILHCSIVDFAPRPESSFDQMYQSKIHYMNKYPIFDCIDKINRESNVKYQDEYTYSFLNETALYNVVLPELVKIPKLIYIGINPVLLNWSGNYWRERPSNINEQLILDTIIKKNINSSISLSELTRDEIKKYTSDNVHYTKIGFNYIYNELKLYLPEI